VLRERKNRENISLLLFFSTKSLLDVFGVWVSESVFHATFVISLFYSERSLQLCGRSPSGEPRKFCAV
jgi:hypothetical protein